MNTIALGIIDAQRGFMPAEEGLRLQRDGFGELAVPDGQQIVEPVNMLLAAFAKHRLPTFTTQDWHPRQTAHFSDNPNFTTDWPVHCVDGTPGAKLHPDIIKPASTVRFIKGTEPLTRGEEDTSYSAFYAEDPTTGLSLPEWLAERRVTEVALGGLALDYCVGKSALDIRRKLGMEVTVVTDAVRGITPETCRAMIAEMEAEGIRLATSAELRQQLEETA